MPVCFMMSLVGNKVEVFFIYPQLVNGKSDNEELELLCNS